MSLRAYQLEGIGHFASRPHVLNFDEPGAGKSAQAIGGAELVGAQRILVLGPAICRTVWPDELAKWWPAFAGELVVEGYDKWARQSEAEIRARVAAFAPDVLILDEIQYIRNPKAKRTVAAWLTATLSPRVWGLSGTPMPKHAGDLYPAVRFMDLAAIKLTVGGVGYSRFVDYFHETLWDGREQKIGKARAERAAELHGILYGRRHGAPLALRRTLAEVGHALPDLTWTTLRIDPPSNTMGLVNALESAISDDVRAALEAGDLQALLQDGQVAVLRRRLGELKATAAATLLTEEWTGQPMVLFAYHRSVLDILEAAMAKLGPVVRVDGSTSDTQRRAAVKAIQSGEARVFLGQIMACQTAITLTRPNQIEIIEPDWLQDTNIQAVKRVHRLTQDRPVFARTWALAGTLDEAVLRVAASRHEQGRAVGVA